MFIVIAESCAIDQAPDDVQAGKIEEIIHPQGQLVPDDQFIQVCDHLLSLLLDAVRQRILPDPELLQRLHGKPSLFFPNFPIRKNDSYNLIWIGPGKR